MKATALFAFLILIENSFAQTLVRPDTMFGGMTRFVEERGKLVHRKYRGEHYFFTKTDDPKVLFMLSEKDKPPGRCRIKTPKKCINCKFFRVTSQGLEYNYDLATDKWSVVGAVNDPGGGKFSNHDGP